MADVLEHLSSSVLRRAVSCLLENGTLSRDAFLAAVKDSEDAGMHFLKLGGNLCCRVLICAPWATHCTLRIVCRRFHHCLMAAEFRVQRRRSGWTESAVFAFGGSLAGRFGDETDQTVALLERWQPFANSPVCLAGARAVRLPDDEGVVLVIGGMMRSGVSSSMVLRFSVMENKWTVMQPMRHARRGHACCGIAGHIMVAGGSDTMREGEDPVPLASVELFDMIQQLWIDLPHMPVPVIDAAVGVIEDSFLVAGGFLGSDISSELQVFNLSSKEWVRMAPLPDRRVGCKGAVRGSKFYVFGGATESDNDAAIHIYDFALNVWSTSGTACPMAIVDGVVEHQGQICVFGYTNVASGFCAYRLTENQCPLDWVPCSAIPPRPHNICGCSWVSLELG